MIDANDAADDDDFDDDGVDTNKALPAIPIPATRTGRALATSLPRGHKLHASVLRQPDRVGPHDSDDDAEDDAEDDDSSYERDELLNDASSRRQSVPIALASPTPAPLSKVPVSLSSPTPVALASPAPPVLGPNSADPFTARRP